MYRVNEFTFSGNIFNLKIEGTIETGLIVPLRTTLESLCNMLKLPERGRMRLKGYKGRLIITYDGLPCYELIRI